MDMEDTQPLPIICLPYHRQETPQERYRRLKAISDATGVRFLFVYLAEQKVMERRSPLRAAQMA